MQSGSWPPAPRPSRPKAAAVSAGRFGPLWRAASRSWATWACCPSTSWRKAATASKARPSPNAQDLLADAEALVQAGAFAVVLELVTPRVAKEITQRIAIPTIGIGAGPGCDGQILVTPDLLGMLPWYNLKHVKPKLNAAEQMRAVVRQWMEGVAKA